MPADDIAWLIKQIERQHRRVGPWEFAYEYPGFFVYHHNKKDIDVFFTPDWDEKDVVSIQVTSDGKDLEGAAIPFKNRTPKNLFNAVLPWLEKYGRKAWGPREWSPRD